MTDAAIQYPNQQIDITITKHRNNQ